MEEEAASFFDGKGGVLSEVVGGFYNDGPFALGKKRDDVFFFEGDAGFGKEHANEVAFWGEVEGFKEGGIVGGFCRLDF